MPHSLSPRRRVRLIRQLRAAHDSLCAWDSSLRDSIVAPPGPPPPELVSLLAVFEDAKRDLDRRLSELGADSVAVAASSASSRSPFPPGTKPANARLHVTACRACGRALGSAFREAQAVADAASASIVYGQLRALEKQMWFLDPLQSR